MRKALMPEVATNEICKIISKYNPTFSTVRVTRYNPQESLIVDFTLLSQNFQVIDTVSEIKSDRVTVGMSNAEGINATADLTGLTNPFGNYVLTYGYYDNICATKFIVVNHLFIADEGVISETSILLDATGRFIGQVPAQTNPPRFDTIIRNWNINTINPQVIEFMPATGIITFISDARDVTASAQIINNRQQSNLFVALISFGLFPLILEQIELDFVGSSTLQTHVESISKGTTLAVVLINRNSTPVEADLDITVNVQGRPVQLA